MGDADRFMREALELARRGAGRVEPNPMVGAVVVRDGRVVGRGWHAVFGGDHAEVAALAGAGEAARGATVFVTLEPCGHEGKTPPCARALAEAGVARVVYAAADPNPVTAGRGPSMLAEAGVEVEGGPLGAEAAALNARCEAHLGSDLPWTVAKWAMTLDGKIADREGGSRYVSGEASRRLAHEIRGAVDAVAVGVGTVLADDPDLTARGVATTRSARRVVFDSALRTPMESRLVATAREAPTWLVARDGADPGRARALEAKGCRVLSAPAGQGGVDLAAALRTLRSEGVARLLLEGGGRIHGSALRAGLVRQVMAFVAPKVLGGEGAPSPVGGEGFRIAAARAVSDARFTPVGDDVLIEGYLDGPPPGRSGA